MEQHLLPPGEVPETAFLPGEFRRLPVPRRAKENDPYFSQSRPRASRSHSIARDLLAEALEAPPAAAFRRRASSARRCRRGAGPLPLARRHGKEPRKLSDRLWDSLEFVESLGGAMHPDCWFRFPRGKTKREGGRDYAHTAR